MLVQTADKVYDVLAIHRVFDGVSWWLDLWPTATPPDWYPIRIPVAAVVRIELKRA